MIRKKCWLLNGMGLVDRSIMPVTTNLPAEWLNFKLFWGERESTIKLDKFV